MSATIPATSLLVAGRVLGGAPDQRRKALGHAGGIERTPAKDRSVRSCSATLFSMTRYQFFLMMVLILWPFVIMGLLFLMSKIESYVARTDADNARGRRDSNPSRGRPPNARSRSSTATR